MTIAVHPLIRERGEQVRSVRLIRAALLKQQAIESVSALANSLSGFADRPDHPELAYIAKTLMGVEQALKNLPVDHPQAGSLTEQLSATMKNLVETILDTLDEIQSPGTATDRQRSPE